MQCSESSPVIIYTPNILICGKIDRFAPDFSEKSIPESIDDGPFRSLSSTNINLGTRIQDSTAI